MGGGNDGRNERYIIRDGLSPRGRGKPQDHPFCRDRKGSIPAWAGETAAAVPKGNIAAVYPRVGGGNHSGVRAAVLFHGLSPRGRGKQPAIHSLASFMRSIPAWAGETHTPTSADASHTVYPRVGGGNCSSCKPGNRNAGLSPRGRGKRRSSPGPAMGRGSIPAWAGETLPTAEDG